MKKSLLTECTYSDAAKAWVILKLNSEGDEIFLADGIGTSWTTDKTQARVFRTRTESRDKIKWEHLHNAVVVRK